MTDATQTAEAAPQSFRAASGDEAESMIEQARQAAEEALHGMKDRAAEYMEQGREKVCDVTAGVEDQIRGRPVQAMAIAAAVGFGLGFLWTRRS